jgi:hypothetical protein
MCSVPSAWGEKIPSVRGDGVSKHCLRSSGQLERLLIGAQRAS